MADTAAPAPARPPLRSLDDALSQLLAQAAALSTEVVSTFEADGRVLAQDLVAALTVPPADNSAMDGYAVRSADCAAPGALLRVTQRIAAGSVGTVLQPGEAARIFTGAPIPPGADAVVMQEDTEVLEAGEGAAPQVRIQQPPAPGQWVRRAGEDVSAGRTVLSRGIRLTPQALGLAASIGMHQLTVVRRPRVALLSTGDELVMPGEVPPEAMKPGAIYNSNRFFLRALLQRMGCEVQDLGIVPDRLDATLEVLRAAAAHNDLILSTGGVSVGEEDHIKPAVQALGQLQLWSIAVKPGKPFAYGAIPRAQGQGLCHVCGLPGNPVSSFVTFLLLVRPFLMALQGCQALQPPRLAVRADFDWPRADRRREFLRARLNEAGGLELFPNQSSGVLTSAVWADGLVDLPAGQTVKVGDIVSFIPLSVLLT
ncbi:molybdopterin molybdotransferase MoeA [Xenophilus arseniciresistens]|uniref:Molybdopterin molybdenumtransferase n=1 Tax=Xenophilus arseniciresistens TaxID=1283306 RepID=A0AAE3N6X7_9BURK|nr:gephyrin-like molybdotransferase Glp [Xenophilus arseniciresistens]MDA7415659.1 molybdopterin molybdotransferase MoeA [Xenophilus arseniciresistens]